MVEGPDGVKHIYPSLQGGEIWYLDPDNPEERTEGENIDGNQEDGFTIGDDGQLGILTTSGDPDLDADIDHSEVESRGYMGNPNDWKDFEATTHWNYLDESSGGTSPSVSIYGRGGHHSNPEPFCPGFKYSSEFETSGRHRFQKEQWHNEYADPTGWKDVGLDDLTEHGWFGHKFMAYNVDIGGGKLGVKLECWIDANADNNWVKVDERLDDGGWGDSGDVCGGDDDQIGTWGGPIVALRIDSADVRFRNTSVRAISATGQFPPSPPPGPPSPPGPPPPSPTPPPSPPPGGGARITINSIHHYAIGTFVQPTCHGEEVPPPTEPPPPPPPPGSGFTTQMKKFAAGYNILEFGDTSSVGVTENE